MNVGLKHVIHPQWVESIFSEMDVELRDRIVKTAIYALVKPVDGGFHIHSFLSTHSNRIQQMESAEDVITAIAITEAWIAYTSTENLSEIVYAEDEEAT